MQKLVYFFGLDDLRPMALINVNLVEGTFPSKWRGKLPLVVEWRGFIFCWQEQLGGYQQWTLLKDLERVNESDVVDKFGALTG